MTTGHARRRPDADRAPRDAYYTPEHVARAILARVDAMVPGTVLDRRARAPGPTLEPHLGSGAWIRAARAEGRPGSVGVDLEPMPGHGATLAIVGDWLDGGVRQRAICACEDTEGDALVAGNPPYAGSHLHEHIGGCLEAARALSVSPSGPRHSTLILLLPLATMETQRRWRALWRDRRTLPTHVIPLVRRVQFTGATGAAQALGAYVWTWWGGEREGAAVPQPLYVSDPTDPTPSHGG